MATKVKAAPGEPVDILLRKFNKKVQMDGILLELKKENFILSLQLVDRLRNSKKDVAELR